MKARKLSLLIFMCVAVTFSGNAAKKWSLTDFGSTAIIGIDGNQNIAEIYDAVGREEEDDDKDIGVLSMAIDKLFYKDDPEPLTGQDRLDYAEDYMRYALENIAEMKVASQDSVLDSDAYSSIVKNPFGVLDYEISATGYTKNVRTVTGKKARILMNELGVNSLVRASFRFNKIYDRQSKWKCNVMPQVIMTVYVFNSKGNQVLMKEYTSNSAEKLPVRKFKYDQEALIELYPAIIENAINQFVMEYLN